METKQPTLVILTPGFARDEEETTCLPMQQTFILTIKKMYPHLNIMILAFQYPYHKDPYTWNNITVIPFNGQNRGGLSKFFLSRKINSFLESVHKKNKITGILSFWYNECGITGKRFANKHGIRHCCWLWGRDATSENKFPQRLRPDPEELVALSDFIQDEFERNHGVRPLHVVTPGIEPGLFSRTDHPRDTHILGAGSLIPLKRYDIFIAVVAEIKKHIPGVKAALIGIGPEKEKLESMISSSGLESAIQLTSELPYPEVLEHMQRAKVFLHTSSYEGFGAVCIEALHGGAHVISFTKPMHEAIPHWQIADGKDDMIHKILEILLNTSAEYFPVTPYTMADSVKKMMKLLGE